MARRKYNPRALVGLTVLIGSVVMVSAVLAGWTSEARDDLRETRARLDRYYAVAAQRGRFEDELTRLKTLQRQNVEQFVRGPTVAQASASLQEYLDRVVKTHGSRIQSVQVLDARAQDDLEPLMMRINLTGDDRALRSILHDLETGQPAIIVSGIRVEPDNNMRRYRAEVPGSDHSLDVTLDIRAFREPQQ